MTHYTYPGLGVRIWIMGGKTKILGVLIKTVCTQQHKQQSQIITTIQLSLVE